MKRTLVLFTTFLVVAASSAFALDTKIRTMMRDMDCVAYKVTNVRQKGAMPGDVAVWLIVNEGPTDVSIRASNGDIAGVYDIYDGESADIFVGDQRYTYTIGLASEGEAKLHVCQMR